MVIKKQNLLDISRYSLFSNKNKKVIGKFKDELHGELIKEIIFMKSKVYAYRLHSESVREADFCLATQRQHLLALRRTLKKLRN